MWVLSYLANVDSAAVEDHAGRTRARDTGEPVSSGLSYCTKIGLTVLYLMF